MGPQALMLRQRQSHDARLLSSDLRGIPLGSAPTSAQLDLQQSPAHGYSGLYRGIRGSSNSLLLRIDVAPILSSISSLRTDRTDVAETTRLHVAQALGQVLTVAPCL